MATVEQNAQEIVLLKQELARTIKLQDYYDQMSDDEAFEHESALARRRGAQIFQASNGEVAFWTYDKESKAQPDDPNYNGTKLFVITSGT
jgi:hypothetical protein